MRVQAIGKTLMNVLNAPFSFVVPDYQRPYSWGLPEIDDFLNDLIEAAENDTTHYFGAFVFSEERKGERILEVCDGQQRLTTVSILLYVLRYFYSKPEFSNAKGVEYRRHTIKELLEFLNQDGEVERPKLILGEANHEFYRRFIVDGWNLTQKQQEEIINDFRGQRQYEISKPIKDAFEHLKDRVQEYIGNISNVDVALERLKNLQDTLLEGFEVVEILVGEDADAFLIFETLNDRGLDLSSVDLIKNRVFRHCASKPDFPQVKERWMEMIRNLDGSVVKKYLRHHWIATYEFTTFQGLFKAVRQRATNYEFCRDYVHDVASLSSYYAGIKNPASLFSNKDLIYTLDQMHSLNFDLTHPILIAAFRKWRNSEDQLARVSRLCLNFLVRYITVLKRKPSHVERDLARLALKLSGDLPGGQVLTELVTYFQNHARDSEFKAAFKTLSVNPSSHSTFFLLIEFEKALHHEVWLPPERRYITVEHILPKTVDFNGPASTDSWAYWFSPEEHEIYLNRLGNLTLLGPSGQGRTGNRPFADKKASYRDHTDMKMTQQICDYEKWTKGEIDKRQEEMSEKAVEIFALKL